RLQLGIRAGVQGVAEFAGVAVRGAARRPHPAVECGEFGERGQADDRRLSARGTLLASRTSMREGGATGMNRHVMERWISSACVAGALALAGCGGGGGGGGGSPPPAVPANVVAMVSGSDIDLTWDASMGATGYKVYYDLV